MALLPCVGLCDYGVMQEVGNGVGCPLSGRYANIQINPFLNAYILGCGGK